ncbi:MAG: GNAT family N-acetyltransferase [Nitrospirota bacterium]
MKTLYEQVLRKIQRDGFLEFCKLAGQIIVNFVYLERKGFLLWRNLQEPIQVNSCSRAVELRQAAISDISKFNLGLDNNMVAKFEERLNNKKLGFLGLIDAHVVSYCWVSLNNEYETWLGTLVCVEKGTVYFYDSYTHPEHRATGIHSAVLHYALIHLRGQGYKSALAVVGIENVPSLRSYRKLGFHEIEMIMTRRVFGIVVKTYKRPLPLL